MGRRLHIGVAAAAVAVLSTTAIASASTLGGVTVTDVFAQNVATAATVPRMRVADAFTSGDFVLSTRSPQDRSYLGRKWTVTTGGWSITATGTAQPQVSSVSVAVYDVGSADIVTSVTLTRENASRAGLIVRSNPDATNYLLAEFRNVAGGSVLLRAIVAGAATTLASATSTGALGTVSIRVEASGNQITVRSGSTVLLSHTLVGSDASTFAGLTSTGIWFSSGTSARFDNFYSATWPAS